MNNDVVHALPYCKGRLIDLRNALDDPTLKLNVRLEVAGDLARMQIIVADLERRRGIGANNDTPRS